MTTTIRVGTGDGRRIRIDVGGNASVTVTSGPGGVSVRIGEDLDAVTRYLGGMTTAQRRTYLRSQPGVTPQMEAAAVRAFLAGADVARLGGSLAAVYRAMEAARLHGDDD